MDKRLERILKNPARLFISLGHREFLNWMDDALYLKIIYRICMHKKLNLDNPRTFNEKLQWLKIYNRNPRYTELVDKYEVRKHIAEQIGEEYLIPLLGGPWDSFDEIDFDTLPDQFVLKCTHDSGGLIICRDKSSIDLAVMKKKIDASLHRNFYWNSREWPYKDVKPRIIAEKYMQDIDHDCLPVYKLLNFHGLPKIIQAIQNDKTENETIDYFDTEWKRLNLRQNFPNSIVPLKRPDQLTKMLELAGFLSEGFSFVRTDFYIINGRIYFSEYTFYSDSGMARFYPENWDEKLGKWIELPIE